MRSVNLDIRGYRLRASRPDMVMPALAFGHAAVLCTVPTVPVIAIGLWWNANTIAHNFIHEPFFRRRSTNILFAAYLSLLLGFPHAWWRDRHLAHHAGAHRRLSLSGEAVVQVALVLLLWVIVAARAPVFFVSVYMPGFVCGLVLCNLHGHYEHARGATSYYGSLYNFLLFNDGYHAEHHADPTLPWDCLPERQHAATPCSLWPAPLRWMEVFSLETLERLVMKSHSLQRFVLRTHATAVRDLVSALPPVRSVAIIGGGLFPRTALILRKVWPTAHITIIEANRTNLDRARAFADGTNIEFVHARYPNGDTGAYEVIVIPLSFRGERDDIYTRPPAPVVLVHDWLWRPRGRSRIVSFVLLKRINLIRR